MRHDELKSDSSELPEENQSLSHQKDQTVRTDEPNLPVKRLLMGKNTASYDEIQDCLTPNLNMDRKRFRKSVENTSDNVGLTRFQDQLMSKIRVTNVACSELSQHGKRKSDSVMPAHESHSDFAEEVVNPQ